MKKTGMIFYLLLATATWANAGPQPSITRGEELFNSEKLGTNGKTCASCHPRGLGMHVAVDYGEDKLSAIINQCINKSLKGKPLAAKSDDLKSIVMYIKSIPPPAKIPEETK